MSSVDCDVPLNSVLEKAWVESAYFRDSIRSSTRSEQVSVVAIFFAVLGHHPRWLKWILLARYKLGALLGMEAAKTVEILHPQMKGSYCVGEKIGPWPIYALSETELVAGRDDWHLDFRLSIFKETGSSHCVISTACIVHNWQGKVYLFFVKPFHKWGIRRLAARAREAGRL
jgi:hypothetical protein